MQRIGGFHSAFLAFLSVLLWLQVGQANAQSAVVVIDSGTTDLFIESLVRTNAETELKKRGFTIVEGASVGGETPKALLACVGDLACTVEALKGFQAEHAFFFSLRSEVENESTNFKIVVRDFEVSTGKVLARTMRRCPECKEELDLAVFTEQMISNLLRPPEAEPAPTPEPALVPQPGPVWQPGTAADTGTQQHEETSDTSKYYQGAKYASLAGGVVGLSVGTYLVLVDGPVTKGGLRQRDANDTLAAGFVTLGAGAVLVSVSAWLWSSKSQDEGYGSTAAIVPSSNGASVLWTGGF